jgi:hypothetical protein
MPARSGGWNRWARASAAWLVAVLALGGCATVETDPYAHEPIARHLERDGDVGYCARLFADIDRRVDALGVRDAEAPRIAGFPYLRVDRLTSALAAQATAEGPARAAWLARLAALDDTGRTAELENAALPADDLARCRVLLAAADAERFDQLEARARVPDAYNTAARAVGLYPLTRLPLAAGIGRWQADTRAEFAVPLAQLPVRGQLMRFGVRTAWPLPEVALPVPRDPLGLPVLSRFDQTALLLRHAPVLEIDVQAAHDRPGTVALDRDDRPVVDANRPVGYTRVTHALFEDGARLQLVYTFWFDERPPRHALDQLSGRMDGLVWRVTLDRDGVPLVYDTIHPCGCYHLFFPTGRVVARPPADTLDEQLFAPQAVRAPGRDEVVVLRIESGTHYVQRVSIEPRGEPAVRYQLDDDRRLTTLQRAAGGTRSAFGPDGLMPGTERSERYYLWPSGVESPGQMRQWGHHATAFVGRRHFDDPRLLDSYFSLGSTTPAADAR